MPDRAPVRRPGHKHPAPGRTRRPFDRLGVLGESVRIRRLSGHGVRGPGPRRATPRPSHRAARRQDRRTQRRRPQGRASRPQPHPPPHHAALHLTLHRFAQARNEIAQVNQRGDAVAVTQKRGGPPSRREEARPAGRSRTRDRRSPPPGRTDRTGTGRRSRPGGTSGAKSPRDSTEPRPLKRPGPRDETAVDTHEPVGTESVASVHRSCSARSAWIWRYTRSPPMAASATRRSFFTARPRLSLT
ncbi:hypothetical protein STRAU_7007 [Streptomyces aurantiacus JA 4570]|uniref:Uncharacterized protein n=1 Tax=Streptomyces aurantiacus JA 4570 TaxID=1286094 RepID=S3Z879_9ACTN|nr:hypothetical protein STRAU_7007 [Streptomyces aurantiacus JA 4570]